MKITEFRTREGAMDAAVARWCAGNNAGAGFAPGSELDGAQLILRASSDQEVDVYLLPDDREIAVADVYGPWAVDITA
jgi:hypothetical protein